MEIGKVSGNVLKRSVLRQICKRKEEVASKIGVDCAIFPFAGDIATCMQEAIIALPGELPLKFAEPCITVAQLIQRCANNLAAGEAEPVAVMLTLLLPKGLEESGLKALMAEAKKQCEELSMELIGGQTRITGQVQMPFAVVAGYGKARKRESQTATPGQDIVISKWIGLEGTAMIVKQNRTKLLSRMPAYLVEEAAGFDRYLSVIPEAATAVKSGVCAMHDASEGGILGALWELAEGAGVGLNIDMRRLPLRQETVEVCECYHINPYELLSGGCLIMTTWEGQGLAEALLAEQIPAVVVGKVTEGKGRILRNGEEIRYLDRPKQDQVYRISCVETVLEECRNGTGIGGYLE